MHGDCWTNATLNGRRFNVRGERFHSHAWFVHTGNTGAARRLATWNAGRRHVGDEFPGYSHWGEKRLEGAHVRGCVGSL